jgi:hypothetical protein
MNLISIENLKFNKAIQMFILAASTRSSNILIVERLQQPLPLLNSRAALLSSTISNGLTFLIKTSFFLKFFESKLLNI